MIEEDAELPCQQVNIFPFFAHSLKLVVNDGMRDVRHISLAIAKTSRFTTLWHGSKYHSLEQHLQKTYRHSSAREWNQLKELTAVLVPFSEATDLTEGEKSIKISMVLPTVLDLNTHLLKLEVARVPCGP